MAHTTAAQSATRLAVGMMMKIVDPYIIIMSPGDSTPTLTASAAASIVPASTGVPAARPVSAAAAGVTSPAISEDHNNSGSRSGPTMPSVRSVVQLHVSTS